MERFWDKVDKNGPIVRPELGACWLWTASCQGDGYGQFRFEGTMKKAHRVSWELTFGVPPKGLLCHACDVRPCVNPEHLFEGDHQSNSDDMKTKKRQRYGEEQPVSKLANGDIPLVRALLEEGVPQTSIAARFGVNQSQISRINTGERWGLV